MNIHQFQASYHVEHDRVLVRLNTTDGQEQRVWFTRRMMLGLFPHLDKITNRLALPTTTAIGHDGAADRAVSDFQRQEVLQNTDFKTPFQSVQPVLLATDMPLLVTAVHVSPHKDESLTLKFDEAMPGSDQVRSMEMNIGATVMLGLMHVLSVAVKASGWGVTVSTVFDAPVNAGPAVAEALPQAVPEPDAFATAQPPKYLN